MSDYTASSFAVAVPENGKWAHRWSWAVALTIFPLIWVGGLVTTQDAGMAVPDWPGTYGYNMFAYPVSAWVYGPFDLMVEHGHRLLGSLAGFLVICLCIAAWVDEPRRWVRWLCVGLLASIIAQGLLGGARVVFDARTLAMIHGCTGPLVFALAAAVVTVTSSWWKRDDKVIVARGWFAWMTVGLFGASVVQLALGAQLRHIQPWASPSFFTTLVHTHLTMALLVLVMVIVVLAVSATKQYRGLEGIRGLRLVIFGLLIVQILLGCGTWIANYALPLAGSAPILSSYTIEIQGYWESWIVTGHQATGSLIIVSALVFALRVWRQTKRTQQFDLSTSHQPTP
jgi:heme a synthase